MLVNKTKDLIVARKVYLAFKFWPKLKGLQFKKDIPPDFAYVLLNCSGIHTCFMRFNLDVAFVNRNWKVIYICKDLQPFRFTRNVKDAHAVIEMKAGNLKVNVGDELELN